jgi:Dickkopf N-terminal cysteine-rich region
LSALDFLAINLVRSRGLPLRLTWAVLSAGLLGCSGSAGNGAGFGEQYASAMCARIFSCCNAGQAAQFGYSSEAQCVTTIGSREQTSLEQVLSTGHVRYVATAAPTCIADIGTASCAALFSNLGRLTQPPSCNRVTMGTGQTGAPCEDLDFYCESNDCEGVCAAPSCRTVVCPTGQYCDSTSLACVPGQMAGATCTYNAECDPSIVCRAGTCGAPLPEGLMCTADSDCATGACLPVGGQTSGSACSAAQPDGSPCTSASECQSGGCNYASTGATCGAPTCTGLS